MEGALVARLASRSFLPQRFAVAVKTMLCLRVGVYTPAGCVLCRGIGGGRGQNLRQGRGVGASTWTSP
eukprot:11181334-Lingulodinium_polyedra.AAC.1